MVSVKSALILLLNLVFIIVDKTNAQSDPRNLSPYELEQLARQILYPDVGYELHSNAIRNQLRTLIENNALQNQNLQSLNNPYAYNEDLDDLDAIFDDEKRSVSTLARNGGYRSNGAGPTAAAKRNVGAMARLGLLRPINQDDIKRSIATLAKNGQLPSREPEPDDLDDSQWNEYKRNIGALARSGNLGGSGKRNIAALARNYELPSYGKRNLPSILRSSGQPRTNDQPKRNIAALARDNVIPYYHQNRNEKRDIHEPPAETNEKRNIGSLKNSPTHGKKVKRDISYDDLADDAELLEPVYQNEPLNYDELRYAMNELYPNYEKDIHSQKRYLGSVLKDGYPSAFRPLAEKRNIGSLARQGLLRNDVSSLLNLKSYRQQGAKRYLGALARSGLMPGFRPIRGGRVSRSGRARSRTDEFYPRPERHLQPIAAACEQCKQQTMYSNPVSWAAPGLQAWSNPSRFPALQQYSFRGPVHPSGDYY